MPSTPRPTDPELQFHEEMVRVYEQAKAECGYVARRFMDMVSQQGGLSAAKQLLAAHAHSEGLTRLWEEGRLDISMPP